MSLWNDPVFSKEYVERNSVMCQEHKDVLYDFFNSLDKDISILELGCNIGLKLEYLKELGFKDLSGLELNFEVTKKAKERNHEIKFIHGVIEEFKPENLFDLVFTSETLIYISPEKIETIAQKIQNMTKKYIFGKEFYSDSPVKFKHRSENLEFWSNDYKNMFKNMKTIRETKIKNPNGMIEQAYLLSK